MNRLRRHADRIALVVLAFLAYARPLVGGATFALRDHLPLVLPARWHLAQALRAARLPEWWEAVGLGAPFAANPNHGALYPPMWLVALVSPAYAADLIVVLHVLLGGLGVAALARRWGADAWGATVAGAAFMLGGYCSSMVPQCLGMLALAWTPWLAWGADRLATAADGQRLAAALPLAAIAGLQILSGDPAGMLDAGLVVLVVLLARSTTLRGSLRALALGGGAAVLALALAAALVLPALALLDESARAGGLSLADAGSWSLHPLRLLELVWPNLLGDGTDPTNPIPSLLAGHPAGFWAMSVYVGAPILLLGAAAVRHVRGGVALAGAALAFVVLALGTHTPVFGWFHDWAPLAGLVRYPEKHLAGTLVLVTALAGVGFTTVFAAPARRRLLVATAAATLLLGGLVAASVGFRAPLDAWLGSPAAMETSTRGGLQAAATLAAFGLALALLAKRAGAARLLAAAAIVLPSLVHALALQATVDRAEMTAPPTLLAGIAGDRRGGLPRIYRAEKQAGRGATVAELAADWHDTATPNIAYPHGFGYFPGYDPALAPLRLDQLVDDAEEAGSIPTMLGLFDVEWIILPAAVAAQSGLPPFAASPLGDSVVVRNQGRRPRAFVASRWTRPDDLNIISTLTREAPDPGRIVLPRPGDERGGDGEQLTPCAVERDVPEDVTLHCATPTDGYAVLLDAWAPGWEASVDDRPAAIERADALVRAVRVSAGAHVIRFRYRAPGLRTGIAVSLIAWAVWLALFVAVRGRRSRR